MKYKMPYKARWIEWDDEKLAFWKTNGKADLAEELMRLYHDEYVPNRLSFFLAHGGGLDFLNDTTHDVVLLRAPNQVGKSIHMIAWVLFHILPCDPDWPCFKTNGIIYRKWQGPKKFFMGSYMWLHMQRNIYSKMAELCPVDELKEYSPHWVPKDSRAKRKTPNWKNHPSVPFACGSLTDLFAYSEPDSVAESMTYDGGALDEQAPVNMFDGFYARGTTVDDFHVAIVYTPHIVEGRPDTGAGTWLQKLDNGTDTKGLDSKVYVISMDQVPDAIVSKENKAHYKEKYITQPQKSGNLKQIRAGRSRWYGEYEASSGLIYDNWEPAVHWIDPFPIPARWPRFRAIDPGRKDPCAAIWAALSPWGHLVFYREYYEIGLGVYKNAKNIIEMSGNIRIDDGQITEESGTRFTYREAVIGERYVYTVMDGRAFKKPTDDASETLGQLYYDAGIDCEQASGMHYDQSLPKVREWFEPTKGLKHILVAVGVKEKFCDFPGHELMNASRISFFNTLHRARMAIESYVNKPTSEKPEAGDDHLPDCIRYMIIHEPRWIPTAISRPKRIEPVRGNAYTGFLSPNVVVT